jgi:phosphate transport system permease protein
VRMTRDEKIGQPLIPAVKNEAQKHVISRYLIDRFARYSVLVTALISFLVLLGIIVFTTREGLPAFGQIGILKFLLGTVWRPSQGEFGIFPMIVGTLLVTLCSMVLATPLGVACAIFLAEVAPLRARQVLRPAVELLVGIPSVVYGVVGLVLIVPLMRQLGGNGYSVAAASIVLMAMVLPTIISISEDSIRAVPIAYKQGALALGATHWQTIWHVLIPAASNGIIASVIRGMGRAFGETMAMIIVIGNSPIIPSSLLSSARTLTGNIAVEIQYASGVHRSALFATGVVLIILILILNSVAILVLRGGRQAREH